MGKFLGASDSLGSKGFDFLSRQLTVKDPLFSVWAAKTRTFAVGSHKSATGHAAVFKRRADEQNLIKVYVFPD